MNRLILVRHGVVENPARVRYGRLPGFPLSASGRHQAALSASFLATCSLRNPLLLSSPLERAVETAEILGRQLGVSLQKEDHPLEIASRYDGLPWGRNLQSAHTFEDTSKVFLRSDSTDPPSKRGFQISHLSDTCLSWGAKRGRDQVMCVCQTLSATLVASETTSLIIP